MAAGEVGGGGGASQGGGQSTGGGNVGQPGTGDSGGRSRPSDMRFGITQPSHSVAPEAPAGQAIVMDRRQDFGDDLFGEADTDQTGIALRDDPAIQGEVMSDGDYAKLQRQWKKSHEEWERLNLADDLPESFAQKFVTVTVDGQRERRTVGEVSQGFMMQRDYSNKLRQLQSSWQDLQARENGLQRLLQDLDRGDTFIMAMENIGKTSGFQEAAKAYGRQLLAESRLDPEAKKVYQYAREQARQQRMLALQNQNLQAQMQAMQMQSPQQSPSHDAMFAQLNQIIPRAAQLVGWTDNPATRQLFEGHFGDLLPTLQGGDITTEFIMNVMHAAQQDYDIALQDKAARDAQVRVGPPGPPANRGLSSTPASRAQLSQNGERLTGNRQQTRARIGELSQQLTNRRGRLQ